MLEKSRISSGAWNEGIEIEGSVEQKLRRAMDGYQNACKDLDSLIYLIVHGCLWGLLHACQLSFFLLNQISQGFSFVRCGYRSSGRSTRFLWRVECGHTSRRRIEKENYVTREGKVGRSRGGSTGGLGGIKPPYLPKIHRYPPKPPTIFGKKQ